jgi:GT2 family glycosyltransferase
MNPLVSVVIVHHRRADLTRRLIGMFAGLTRSHALEIILVAIAADEEFADGEFAVPVQVLRMPENRGYGAACNAGSAIARGSVLIITNNDVEFDGDALGPLLTALDSDPAMAAVGPRMYFPDGRLQLSYSNEPSLWNGWMEQRRQKQCRNGRGFLYDRRIRAAHISRDADWITGAFFAVRASAFREVVGFDERFFLYFEDADLCQRLRAKGHRIHVEPLSSVVHYGGASQDGVERLVPSHSLGQLRYFAKHRSRISFFILKLYLTAKFYRAALRTPAHEGSIRAMLMSIRRFPFRSEPDHHDVTQPLHA